MTERRHTTTEAHDIPTSQVASEGPTGGEILVRAMRDAGVEVAFGVISIHNIPLVEAVDRDLRFVPVRHEAAAVNAADGYARTSGGIGVAITSTGTGAGNAAGAMLEALTAQSRVLHVTGNIDSTFLGEDRGVYHEVPRQLEMLRSVSRHALRIERPRDAGRVIADAMRLLAMPPHGPVSIDWPIDLQYTADPATQMAAHAPEPRTVTPEHHDVERAAQVMRRARGKPPARQRDPQLRAPPPRAARPDRPGCRCARAQLRRDGRHPRRGRGGGVRAPGRARRHGRG